MSDFNVFDISASGMAVERMRLQVGSMNIANVNTTRTQNGSVFQPLTVLSSPKYAEDFDSFMTSLELNDVIPLGVQIDSIESLELTPRTVYEPSHPDADSNGYVSYPNINPVIEMVNLINITRSYEANVRAFNAAKKMYQTAIDIGGR